MQFWIVLDDILLVPWHKEKCNQIVFYLFFIFASNCFSCAFSSQLRSFLLPHFVMVKHRGFTMHCVEVFRLFDFFFLQHLLSALSAKLRVEEGEELGQQPWACHCFWVIQPTPPCLCCFPTISFCSSVVPPLCFPPLFWSRIIALATQSLLLCKSVQCPTLLCLFSRFPIFTPMNVAWYFLCALVQCTFLALQPEMYTYFRQYLRFLLLSLLEKKWFKPFISTNRWVNSEGGT